MAEPPAVGLLDRAMDLVGDHAWRLVLPVAQDCPSSGLERGGVAPVALHVAVELLRPVRVVCPRRRPVVWASVPEAPVDKDCHARPDEHDVGSTSEPPDGGVVLSKSKPTTMQRAAYCDLGRGVSAVPLHNPPHGRARGAGRPHQRVRASRLSHAASIAHAERTSYRPTLAVATPSGSGL